MFRMNTYKNKGLKVPLESTLTKKRGGGTPLREKSSARGGFRVKSGETAHPAPCCSSGRPGYGRPEAFRPSSRTLVYPQKLEGERTQGTTVAPFAFAFFCAGLLVILLSGTLARAQQNDARGELQILTSNETEKDS